MVQQDTNFPADKLPQCWSDDIRMNALFAPFRLKSSNPESWEMKMKFWSDMIKQWCRHRRDPIVSAADVKFAFQRKGRTPACIVIVVEEMFRNGDLAHVSKYPQILHNGPEGWLRWGVRIAFRPAALAVTAVSTLLPSKQLLDSDGLPKASIDATQRFVVESVVKDEATELIQNFPPGEERLGTIEELMKKANWQQSRETFEVILSYLVLNGAAVKKGDVVKLAEPNKKASQITEADESLVRLMCAENRLESDAIRLSKEISAAEADAKAALKVGNKVLAKSHLRRKHRTLQRLTRCETALENVRQLLHQAKEMSSNVDILATYKTSSQAMKATMQDAGLSEDHVLDTMDELKEVMDSYNEVEKALSTTTDDYDQLELEDELKELLSGSGGPSGGTPQKEEKREREGRREEVPILPSPPAAVPKPRKASEREFVFDGEARMIAELNDLSDHDLSLRGAGSPKKPKDPSSQPWYPQSSKNVWGDNDLDSSVDKIADGFAEIMQDERLHPGQPLDLNFSSPPRLYNTEFKVRDHKPSAGVEMYNSKENTSLKHSTEYFSAISPGKFGAGSFQMAPGGERKKSTQIDEDDDDEDSLDDLERRLKDLRGLKS